MDETNPLNITPLSHMESCCVDGTSTQLLVESYCDRNQQNQPSRILQYDDEEALLSASFSVSNSSRSAKLLSIPPVRGSTASDGIANASNRHLSNTNGRLNPQQGILKVEPIVQGEFETNTKSERQFNGNSDLNDSQR